MDSRASHWIKPNHQERMPPRMVAFDTESRSVIRDGVETQSWRVGCAIRWRTDTKSGDMREAAVFNSPADFWEWVSEYTKKGTRTVVWAHNLGHDVRISAMFEELPKLGFRLEWCNLDRNISSATWRSERGSIVLADTWTWIPLPLNVIAPQVGMVKYAMPPDRASDGKWAIYCMQDAEILFNVVRTLMGFISSRHLGNWQPTGAGMAYTTWRHRFMNHKVLVHDDVDALAAERSAMHTGRAEAWRHGKLYGEKWTEVDLRNAYVSIAASTPLPRKLHMHTGAITVAQFKKLNNTFAVLSHCRITTEQPSVPVKRDGRFIWPVGTFDTWLWDNELQMALRYGANVKIRDSYTYVRAMVLQDWAKWVLGILRNDALETSNVVKTHIKHCSRALIGRIALRTPSWELWGDNLTGQTGIGHMTFPATGKTVRLLHVGKDVLIERSREEGKDSLPMITGYIMAECRCIMWEGMNSAGLGNIAHVDTDSILCNSAALDNLRRAYGDSFPAHWTIKGTYTQLEIFGPRAYYRDKQRVTAGIPLKAIEVNPGEYEGESWSALASDLETGKADTVTVRPATWHLKTSDPRRADSPGGGTATVAVRVAD